MRPWVLLICLAGLVACSTPPDSGAVAPPQPTPTFVARDDGQIRLSARPLPVSTDARWSPNAYQLEVQIHNLTSRDQPAMIITSVSEGLHFSTTPQEPTQQLQSDDHVILQEILLPPRLGEEESFKTLYFHFSQRDALQAGTYNLDVQAVLPGQDPLRVVVVFVVEPVMRLARAKAVSPSEAPATAESQPSPADASDEPQCPENTIVYAVQKGDTLRRLAEAYQTTVPDILDLNPGRIPNPDSLRIGAKLCLPHVQF